jgi:hypothetical protein
LPSIATAQGLVERFIGDPDDRVAIEAALGGPDTSLDITLGDPQISPILPEQQHGNVTLQVYPQQR